MGATCGDLVLVAASQRDLARQIQPVPAQYANFILAISEFEPVRVLAGNAHVRAVAAAHLAVSSRIELVDIPTNDAWCRDHGPMFLAGPSHLPPALVDWKFNAWGEKYFPFDADDAVPANCRVAAATSILAAAGDGRRIVGGKRARNVVDD